MMNFTVRLLSTYLQLQSNTIKGTLIASVSLSHFTSKGCICRSGTLVTNKGPLKGETISQKYFHTKYF